MEVLGLLDTEEQLKLVEQQAQVEQVEMEVFPIPVV